MADIFGNDIGYGGGFRKKGEQSAFQIGLVGGGLSLVQDVNIQYGQNVQPLYEVGSANVYFSQTAASGTATINRIVKKGTDIDYEGYDVCNDYDITISNSEGGGNCLSGDMNLTLGHCVIQQVQWQMQAQNAYITEGVTIQFAYLNK